MLLPQVWSMSLRSIFRVEDLPLLVALQEKGFTKSGAGRTVDPPKGHQSAV
jgi:hypothetical protein